MGEAGVSLNDSVDNINAKLTIAQNNREVREFSNEITMKGGVAVADPSSVPANQLVSYKDANGVTHYYKMPASSSDGLNLGADDPRVSAYVSLINKGQYNLEDVPADIRNSVAAALGQSMAMEGISFEDYLNAAQETSLMSYGPSLVEELRQQYNSLIGNNTSTIGGTNVNDWVFAVKNDYATLNQVPDEIKSKVLSQLSSEE